VDAKQCEYLVARICSGTIRLRPHPFLLKKPTREQIYIAQEIYQDHLEQSPGDELMTDEELLEWLLEYGIWNEEKQKLFLKLPKEIEEFKVALFQAGFKSNEQTEIKKAIAAAKAKIIELSGERYSFDHLSISGCASMAKSKYLVGCGLHWTNGTPVFNMDKFWQEDSERLDAALLSLAEHRLTETTYRELARKEPWRSLWSIRKVESSLFGIPAIEYSDEQKELVGWSQLYDSVYEHPNKPSDFIIENDDYLDGWMIVQRREQEKNQIKQAGDELTKNEKIRGASEIFVPADTIDDARKVEVLNDDMAKATKKVRFKSLAKSGELNEADMPDTKRNMQMNANRLLMSGGK